MQSFICIRGDLPYLDRSSNRQRHRGTPLVQVPMSYRKVHRPNTGSDLHYTVKEIHENVDGSNLKRTDVRPNGPIMRLVGSEKIVDLEALLDRRGGEARSNQEERNGKFFHAIQHTCTYRERQPPKLIHLLDKRSEIW